MNDSRPPESSSEQEEPAELSLPARIQLLQQEHRTLDEEIETLYQHPYRDQLHLQRLKKRKLRIKDTIEKLKDDLIPDLNA